MKKKLYIIFGIILFILILGNFIYLFTYYHAESNIKNDINVIETDKYLLFDSASSDNAIIFYPGARVESKSYSNLANMLSKYDIDVYVLKLPFRVAFFGIDYPDEIIENNNYNKIYLMGHSLGGVIASYYLSKTNKNIDGIIFLASYSTLKIKDDVNIISIYGSNDGVLNLNNYNKYKSNLNNNYHELVISGGNHAGFGNYGKQLWDNESDITNAMQQEETVNFIINNFNY